MPRGGYRDRLSGSLARIRIVKVWRIASPSPLLLDISFHPRGLSPAQKMERNETKSSRIIKSGPPGGSRFDFTIIGPSCPPGAPLITIQFIRVIMPVAAGNTTRSPWKIHKPPPFCPRCAVLHRGLSLFLPSLFPFPFPGPEVVRISERIVY